MKSGGAALGCVNVNSRQCRIPNCKKTASGIQTQLFTRQHANSGRSHNEHDTLKVPLDGQTQTLDHVKREGGGGGAPTSSLSIPLLRRTC